MAGDRRAGYAPNVRHNRGAFVTTSGTSGKSLALWIGIGLAVGAGVGVAMQNIGAGVGGGLVLGIAIGVAMQQRSKKNSAS